MRSDSDLLRQFIDQSDEAAFAELVRRYGGLVHAVCARATSNSADAADASQAVFLVLANKARAIVGRPTIAGWLHHVASHVAKRLAESQRARRRREREAADDRPVASESREDWRLVVDEALAKLPEKYRLPLILHHMQEEPPQAVAAKLGLKPSALSMRLARGRELLRRGLERAGCAPAILTSMTLASSDTANALDAERIAKAAIAVKAGGAAATSEIARALYESAKRSFAYTQAKIVTAAATILLAVTGVGLAAAQVLREPATIAAQMEAPPAPPVVADGVCDRWLVGEISGVPAFSLHQIRQRGADGDWRSQVDMTMVIKRTIGASTMRVEFRQSSRSVEDADGGLKSLVADEEQDGHRTTVRGEVVGNEIVATSFRLGQMQQEHVPIPEGIPLVGEIAGLRLAASLRTVGATTVFGQPVPMTGTLRIARCIATLKSIDDAGDRDVEVVMDLMPAPLRCVLGADGELRSMAIDMGIMRIALKPSPGPVVLPGAEIASTGIVRGRGPAPTMADRNRYRLADKALAALPEDSFQHREDGLLVVASDAGAERLADPAPFLAEEPQVELSDPEMRAWVDGVVAGCADTQDKAERLRLAVRSRIAAKNLGTLDASALEAFRNREGDCTEHANLLCACLRIAGIPARSEVGFVYSFEHGGWVGHAWNSAHVGDRWVHLDSALPQKRRSLYVKLASPKDEGLATAIAKAFIACGATTIETVPTEAGGSEF
jgi:RNA polymerase sigma factor (sigma-70 family)